ncbi:MAG: MlaA family lipoprotein [Opitutales bacterium]
MVATLPVIGQEEAIPEDILYGPEEETAPVSDPLEGFNRSVFRFNDLLYRNVLDPVADGYDWLMPDPAQTGVSNFFYNIRTPVRLVGSVLQGKLGRGGREVGSFVINTTVGLFGFLRPSEEIFGTIPAEDIGQTLAVWGIGEGPYLVLPLLGPSNLRDAVGFTGDIYLNPAREHSEWEYEAAAFGLDFVNTLPGLTERYEALQDSAVAPYISLRNAYLQNRRQEVDR